ncbi:contactin-5-like [Scomber scombrus]|uniref:contactin-5-like n=1 Tax=Scomber scombrus TaxID=13677 RepID=UPI002DD9B0B7|nr:contactin-5-like [Scomber scombrus]
MKSSTVCLLLGVSVLLLSGPTDSAVSLRVSPDLQQLFSRESPLTLSCDEDGQTADGWTVKRTTRGGTGQCGGGDQQDFGRIESSNCIISYPSPLSDSGVYWCERSGEKSEEINITVTDLTFKLEIPALPVLTGSDVTLRCRTRDGSTPAFNVLKNGEAVTGSSKGELIISKVQQSDEGFYSCVNQNVESLRSRLRVKAPPPPTSVSLRVSPDLQQFFSRESPLTLSCDEDGQTADGWTVKRTTGGQTGQCGGGQQDFGRIEGSNCIISDPFESDSGVYWCERSGERSEEINITVTDLPFKLDIPAIPVLTGSDVTLRCRTRDGSTHRAFYLLKNGEPFRSDSKGEFIISNVQQSDEGFYSCSDGLIESPRSMLRVKAPPPPPPLSVVRLLCHLVVISPYCICSVLMVSIYCSRRTGNRPAVSMETSQRDAGGQGSDGERDDVTTEHDF